MKVDFKKLIFSIIACQMAGFIGSLFTAPAIPGWYVALQKPFFSPPNWLFAPVWIILYLLMSISLYLVWNSESKNKKSAIFVFSIQLILNSTWSIVFFGLKSPLAAFLVIIVLWLLILKTIIEFGKISKISQYLLIPYIAWVSFASILNLAIVILN